jgi:hypothetical protein
MAAARPLASGTACPTKQASARPLGKMAVTEVENFSFGLISAV